MTGTFKKGREDLRTNRPNISQNLQIYQKNPTSKTVDPLDHQGAIKQDQRSAGKINDLLAWVYTREDGTIL